MIVIAGPCVIESEEQVISIAEELKRISGILSKNNIGLCYISNVLNVIKDIDDIRNLKDININPSKDCDMISNFS